MVVAHESKDAVMGMLGPCELTFFSKPKRLL
jgi:hypothetical protein